MKSIAKDCKGATAFEFTLIAIPLFMLFFGIFDVSRYALTWYSVSSLADEAARQQIVCYSPLMVNKVKTVNCPSDPFTNAQKQTVAPALFWGNLKTPTVVTSPTDTTVSRPRTVTASVSGFTPALLFIPGIFPDKLTVIADVPF